MDKFTARRKILRGSLSAPVVLTVASPASLAAASTTCLINTNQNAPPPFFQPASTDDGYLRKTVEVCEVKSSNGWQDGLFYEGQDDNWYSVTTGQPLSGTFEKKKHCVNREVLVYVDAQGQETGYGWPSTANGGSFTSIGCWNSLLITP
jgi:hypothetical protein